MIIHELLGNIALLIAACLIQRVIVQRWRGDELWGRIASGILFGGAAVVGMMAAFTLAPGVIFDARTVVLSAAALFGGPLVGATAGAIAAAFRIWLGGGGTVVALATMTATVAIGLVFHYRRGRRPFEIGLPELLLLGLLVHVASIALFYFLPLDFQDDILGHIAVPYLATLVPATAALGLALREIEKIRKFDVVLEASEDRFRILFDTAAVGMFEEDLSLVFRILQRLRAYGVRDVRRHLTDHPEVVDELIAAIQVIRVNAAGRRMFGANDDDDLLGSVDRTFLPGVKSVLLEAATALWEGRSNFISEAHFRTLDGRPLVAIMSMPVPTTEEEARRVPVSFVDVTARKAMEEELAQERRRLQEIIWGTNVGTWEWNVQTGAVTVNERWAEMVGYTIAELSPISIATWTGLAHPDDLKASEAQLAQVFAGALDRYECEVRMRHRNGDFIWVLDRGKVIERDADGRPLRMSGTHTDVTQRKRAEAKAARLAAIRELILRCDRVILREPDETKLLRRLVEMLVESRGYAFVWIGVPRQDAERSVEPVAWAGAAAAFLEGVTVHWSDDAFSQGPTARAIKTGSPQTIRSIADAPGLAHIADAAARCGLVSVIALPILVQGRVDAVLSAFSVHADSFDEDETALLLEFAANLGLAMQTRRTEAENEQFRLQLDRAALGAINAVAATLEKRDPYTSGHQERVARLSVAIATELGWERSRIEGLRLGAMIHDIGKISVPSEILNRPGRLTEGELAILKAHPQVGYEILEKSDFPWPIRDMIHQHHERLDGSGYPQGLTGERIIAEAKVIAVADVLEAISSHRPYRPALGLDAALREIEGGRGTIYDAEIVDVCVRLVRDRGFRWESPDPAVADLATR